MVGSALGFAFWRGVESENITGAGEHWRLVGGLGVSTWKVYIGVWFLWDIYVWDGWMYVHVETK